MITGVTRHFSNSPLSVGYPDETLSLVFDILHDRRVVFPLLSAGYPDETLSLMFDILHDNWSYVSFLQLSSQCWIS